MRDMLNIEVHTGEWAQSPYGPAMKTKPAKISRGRTILCYDIDYLRKALLDIERAIPTTMPRAIERMREKIQVIGKHIDEVLISYGDIDPRGSKP